MHTYEGKSESYTGMKGHATRLYAHVRNISYRVVNFLSTLNHGKKTSYIHAHVLSSTATAKRDNKQL